MADSNQHSMEDDIAYIRANLATKYLGHPDDDALYALDRLEEQLEAERREEWREGIVNVLDHEGNYLGCIGSETWTWTLDGGIERMKEQLEALTQRLEAAGNAQDLAGFRYAELQEQYEAQEGALKAMVMAADLILSQQPTMIPGKNTGVELFSEASAPAMRPDA